MSQQSGNERDQGEQGNPVGQSYASQPGGEQWEHREQSQGSAGSTTDPGQGGGHQQEQPQTWEYGQTSADPYAQGSANAYGQASANPHSQPSASQYGQSDQYGQGNEYGQGNQYGQQSANQYGQPSANPQGDWNAGQAYGQGNQYGQQGANQYGQPSANPQGDWNNGQQGDWNAGQAHGQMPPQGMPNQGYPPSGAPMMAGPPVSPSDEKLWGWLVHVLMIVTTVVGPLIVYLMFKDRSKWITDNAKEALNFAILSTIILLVGSILTIVVIGIVPLIVWPILMLVFGIMAAIAANEGRFYKYPLNLRLVS